MLKSNLHYFKLSIDNPERLEKRYMFLDKDKHLDEYIAKTKELKDLLTTIKTLNSLNTSSEDVYKRLHTICIDKYSSKSELNCFLNACDSTIFTLKDDFNSFKEVVNLYLENRELTDSVPAEWIQAIIDKGASRSKGYLGENKLVEICEKAGFQKVASWADFKNNVRAVATFKKHTFDVPNILAELGIDLNFDNDKKMLDLIVKNKEKIIFVEAKHLKESGGTQDKQIEELIKIIKTPSHQVDVYYAAFIDGLYSNNLLSGITDTNIFKNQELNNPNNIKIISQQTSIIKALKTTPSSFWLNTFSFNEFIHDL